MHTATDKRQTREVFESATEGKPYDLFVLRHGERRLVGRKTEAAYPDPGSGQRLKSCLVEEDMLLGVVEHEEISEEGVTVHYRPLSPEQRRAAFAAAVQDRLSDLSYPYAPLTRGRPVTSTAPAGWMFTPERARLLDHQEIVLRAAAAQWLARSGIVSGTAYDAACSTGAFLAAAGAAVPGLRTVGQDLSAEMTGHAAKVLDEVHHGDSIRPGVPPGSADVVFCRHLNIFVVDQDHARDLFLAAAGACRLGGRIVVLGHTPVLLPSAWFEELGLHVEQRTGATPSGHALFQFYVLRKDRPVGPEAAATRS